MEIGGQYEVIWIVVATSPFLDGSALRVQAFDDRVGVATREYGQTLKGDANPS